MRYLVGIDLGTTHCAVAYSPADRPSVRQLPIPQLVAPGQIAARPQLPSFLYLPVPGELDPTQRELPWGVGDPVIGEWARELSARSPNRGIASSKSWICHGGVNRKAPILPWSAPDDARHLSPFQASVHLLSYLRAAWDHSHPDAPLADQQVVITVPASFDEVARQLTVEAAEAAGLPTIRLLEEPQAALYDFLGVHHESLGEVLGDARLALVVDVGGGTTDLTLVQIAPSPDREPPEIRRIAVGGHLMLGGDNMDAALAHLARSKAGGPPLDPTEWSRLVQDARRAKEQLLGEEAQEQVVLSIQRRGSRLIGGTQSVPLQRDTVWKVLIDGFLPFTQRNEVPERAGRAGLTQLGLPYESDPAIPRHVCAFLRRHATACAEAGATVQDGLPRPDLLLLNGGVFRADRLVHRFTEVLDGWFDAPIQRLPHTSLDTAVSRGAVRFLLANHGFGLQIAAGAARAFYVGVEDADGAKRALCVAPKGLEEGKTLTLSDQVFDLALGRTVAFDLYSSSADRTDSPGQLVEIHGDLDPLPRVTTALAAPQGLWRGGSDRVPVTLSCELTEHGTLQLSLVTVELPPHRWRLAFELGESSEASEASELSEAREREPQGAPESPPPPLPPRFDEAAQAVRRVFGAGRSGRAPDDGKRLRKELEGMIGPRGQWSVTTCRALADLCLEQRENRGRTPAHELSFMRLVGWGMRPGTGFEGDEARARALWEMGRSGPLHPDQKAMWADTWVMWRRVAAGLSPEAQHALFDEVAPWLTPTGRPPAGPKKGGPREMMNMVATLEHLDAAQKEQAGGWCLQRFKKIGSWWALGRLGSRVPVYGSIAGCVSVPVAEAWLEGALAADWSQAQGADLAAVLLGARTHDAREVSEALRDALIRRLRQAKANPHWLALVTEGVALQESEASALWGEALPSGLRLRAGGEPG